MTLTLRTYLWFSALLVGIAVSAFAMGDRPQPFQSVADHTAWSIWDARGSGDDDDDDDCGKRSPSGTYLLTISSDQPGVPPFVELLSLHRNGTLTETNTGLHSNSANTQIPGLPFNASDGHGAWKRDGNGGIRFKFFKLLFSGPDGSGGPSGFPVGALQIVGKAEIQCNSFNGVSEATILLGPDLDNPDDILPLGVTTAAGRRVQTQ